MRITAKTRAWVLGIALVATLVAAFVPEERVSGAAGKPLVGPAKTRTPAAPAADEVPDIAILRKAAAEPLADPFSPDAWRPPPPPAAKAPPPPAPTAPEFPYAYQGRVDDAGKASVLLGRGDKSLAVQAGDTIDGTWRIEKISERSVDLLYLPLKERQSISAGSNP